MEEGGCGQCVADKPRETDGRTHGENRNGDVIRNKNHTVATKMETSHKTSQSRGKQRRRKRRKRNRRKLRKSSFRKGKKKTH